jgi:hypothetical protein
LTERERGETCNGGPTPGGASHWLFPLVHLDMHASAAWFIWRKRTAIGFEDLLSVLGSRHGRAMTAVRPLSIPCYPSRARVDLENAYTQDVFRLGDSALESPRKPVGVKDPVSQVSTLLRQLKPREQLWGTF